MQHMRSRNLVTFGSLIILLAYTAVESTDGFADFQTIFASQQRRFTTKTRNTTTRSQQGNLLPLRLQVVSKSRYYKENYHGDDNNDDKNAAMDQVVVSQRRRQIRKKPIHRKPRNYWLNPKNLQFEIYNFWNQLGIDTNRTSPTIPNETILHYFQRNDIRAAIVKNGGRATVSILLNDAPVMPGRWKDAIASSIELQQLLLQQTNGIRLSPDRPPWTTMKDMSCTENSSKITTTIAPITTNVKNNITTTKLLWSHQEGRNQKGHWNLQKVIQELYEYVDKYKIQHNRPAVWMPRPSELSLNGRDDLRQAMNRYGGVRNICRTAGMISYHEWFYFEGQLELLNELKLYLDIHASGDYTIFPNVSDIKRNGYHQLHNLIQYYGGRKFLSSRLNMSIHHKKKDTATTNYVSNNNHINDGTMIQFGLFDLVFAIRLLNFVRIDQLQRSPPLQLPMIAMPSRTKLLTLTHDGMWLDTKIDEFGGYENVARRLGLALFSSNRIVE